MQRILAGLLMVLLCAALAGCGGPDGKAAVKWPALAKLDDSTHRLAAAAESASWDEFLEEMAAWSEAAMAVASEQPPANVANRDRVAVLQRDIASLAKTATTAKGMPEEFARKMAKGLEPTVDNLMLAAGMPHVHGNADGHDHGHDHDHDHDEEAEKKEALARKAASARDAAADPVEDAATGDAE